MTDSRHLRRWDIPEALGRMPGLALTSSGSDNFEVVADGADKGKALCLLASEWGIAPAEIAAIRDSDNIWPCSGRWATRWPWGTPPGSRKRRPPLSNQLAEHLR